MGQEIRLAGIGQETDWLASSVLLEKRRVEGRSTPQELVEKPTTPSSYKLVEKNISKKI